VSTRGTFCLDYVYLFFHRKLHSMKKKLVFFKNASDDMRKSKGEAKGCSGVLIGHAPSIFLEILKIILEVPKKPKFIYF